MSFSWWARFYRIDQSRYYKLDRAAMESGNTRVRGRDGDFRASHGTGRVTEFVTCLAEMVECGNGPAVKASIGMVVGSE